MKRLCIDEELIPQLLDIFKSKSRPNYTPLFISGSDIVTHFNLDLESGEIDKFFNVMCYELNVLSINPGTDEISYHWQDNDFGLLEPYSTQLIRDNNLNGLGI
jgi:hypothetical protein